MDRNFERAVTAVLKHEGGYVDHPKDPGGATNKGVTIATFRRYVKPSGTKADLKALTVEQAKTVYRRQYWDAVHGAELPSGLDFAVFDFGVNSGPSRAVKTLQRLVGAAPDGKIGPVTLDAVRARGTLKLIKEYQDARLAFLKGLRTWGTFGKGWSRRVNEVGAMASAMATELPVAPTPSVDTHSQTAAEQVKMTPAKVETSTKVSASGFAALLSLISSAIAAAWAYYTNG